MQRVIRWLECHRAATLLISLAYYAAGLFLHDRANVLCNDFRTQMGTGPYQGALTGLFLAMLAGCCLAVCRSLWRGAERTAKLGYAVLTLILMVAGYQNLFILNTEAVHYVQYTGLAILLYPLLGELGLTCLWTSLLGAADEAHQYWVVYADRSTWYDFNDVVLNILGAAAGCLLIWIVREPERARAAWDVAAFRRCAARPAWCVGFIFAAVPVAACAAGVFVRFPADELYPWQVVLARGFPDPQRFWDVTAWGKTLHNLSPAEGIALSALLLAVYLPMDLRLFGRRP